MEDQRIKPGIAQIDVATYPEFSKYVDSLSGAYVFRGQACDWWELRPSLSHFFSENRNGVTPLDAYTLTKKLLASFRQGLCKCVDEVPFLGGCDPSKLGDMDLWTIGRHYQLRTPILDWTEDAFVATFFAFDQERREDEDQAYPWRAVWAADLELINRKFLPEFCHPTTRFTAVHFFHSQLEFPRIRKQRGLFSYGPALCAIEDRVQDAFQNSTEAPLIKISIPDSEKTNFIHQLNNRNISRDGLLSESEDSTLTDLIEKCHRELTRFSPL